MRIVARRTTALPLRSVMWAPMRAPGDLAGGHGEGDGPENPAFGGEEGHGGEVAAEVDELGVGAGAVEGVMEDQGVGEDEEGAGAGAEEAVVRGDEEGDGDGEPRGGGA